MSNSNRANLQNILDITANSINLLTDDNLEGNMYDIVCVYNKYSRQSQKQTFTAETYHNILNHLILAINIYQV